MPLHTVVTLVTFQNSSPQLALYARALKIAAEQAAPVCKTTLLYQDNGAESGLEALVPFAVKRPARGNVGYGPALAGLLEFAFHELHADLAVTSNPDGAFHHQCLATLAARASAEPRQLLEARQFPDEHPKRYDPLTGATDWASGCCLAVSRNIFDEIGNIDPGFWLYLEDVDYSWRARAHGIPVRLVPEALYAHDVTDRPVAAASRLQMLLAGRRLGVKWHNERFTAECERMLQSEFPDPSKTWDAAQTVQTVPPAWTRVSDFRHHFSFSRTRW